MKTYLGSSADPTKLAATWKGILLGLIPVIVIIAKQFGIELDSTELVKLIVSALEVVSSVTIAFGIGRKIVIKAKKQTV